MILTKCAACAAPLAHDAPRCVRCKIRYCNLTCQHDHWRRGHKQICKKFHRGGNAEQYNADKKYKEAVAVAAEACAEDTKGQTCYICTEAVHWKTKEGLVRMCACRGTSGFAHLSCLAEQAKILVAEVEGSNLDYKAQNERWNRWHMCGLCEQRYHGVVNCALGWACWKTYLGRLEEDKVRRMAMTLLGNDLTCAQRHEDALSVLEAELALQRRLGDSGGNILAVRLWAACVRWTVVPQCVLRDATVTAPACNLNAPGAIPVPRRNAERPTAECDCAKLSPRCRPKQRRRGALVGRPFGSFGRVEGKST